MPRLPIKFPSTRVKSPAPRPRPSRKAHHSPSAPAARRSRSHDDRRPSDAGRHPPSSSRRRDNERDPRRDSPSPEPRREHARRRRRDSSSSPERYPRRVDRDYLAEGRDRRPSSLAPEKKDRRPSRERPSSARYPSPPRVRPGATGAFNREGEDDPRKAGRRSSTPDRYKPDRYKDRTSSSKDAGGNQDAPSPQSSPQPAPSPAPAASGGSSSSNLFNHVPAALTTYAGIKAVTKHADTAKDWIKWLGEMNETPEEIQDMSAKATTARDTITQVQETLKARPDLLEDDKGQTLKGQIEDAIRDTDKALGGMTKLLSEISKKGADHGDAINGMQEFWRSYRYKDEFKEKVEKADEDLQKELTHLSTLMVNIYSRALMKPAPPGAASVPPPAPIPEEKVARSEEKGKSPSPATDSEKQEVRFAGGEQVIADATHPATTRTSSDAPRPSIPTIVTPDPERADGVTRTAEDERTGSISPPPQSPSAVAAEEAAIGSPPMSAGDDTIRKPGSLPTPPPTVASEAKRAKEAGERPASKRGSIASEEEAQDILLDAAWDGDLDAAARALRYVSHGVCDMRGLTALHLAAERDNLAVAILLLDRGADPQARSDGGRTALHLAARSASASMVEMLIERGKSDPNTQTAKGRTPLHYAASKAEDGDDERREVLRVLRDWGADPTIEDKEGETARDVAQKREHWDAASTLRRAERKWEEEHKQGWLQRHGFLKG